MAKAGHIDIGVNIPKAEVRKAEAQLRSLFSTTQNFNKNPIVAKNFTQPLGRITGAANEFNKSLEASNARVIAFGASAGAIFAVQKAMQSLVRTAIEVEQQFREINVLFNLSAKNFKRFGDGLFKVAKQTGTAFNEVAESATEFARQGLTVEETLKRTNAALMLTRLSGMNAVNATESLTAALNTFNKAGLDATTIVNKMAQADAKFAVSSGDLAEAIKRTGASAVSAKVSFDELIAMVTVAQEKTARGGSVIGNSFKTIFTRIQRPEVLNQLAALGIAVRKSSGEVLPAVTILKSYAKTYESLTPALKSTTAEMLAGVFQVNVLKAVLPDLAQQTGKYAQALQVAGSATDEATRRMADLTDTTKGRMNAAIIELTSFAAEVGKITIMPAIENIVKALNNLVNLIKPENFFGLGETVGKSVYEGIGKIISGPGLLLLGTVLAKIGGRLAVFVKDAAGGFLGLNTASEKLAQTQNVIQNVLAQRPKLIAQATASEEGMVAVARALSRELTEANRQMVAITSTAAKMAPVVVGGAAKGGAGKKGVKAPVGFVPGASMGFVPNFASNTEAERQGAAQGGYSPGKIRKTNIPGVGSVTYNGNEQIKKFDGLQQPAIMPPALSEAGTNYRKIFKDTHGFDPYNAADGFVPNFNRRETRKGNVTPPTAIPEDMIWENADRVGLVGVFAQKTQTGRFSKLSGQTTMPIKNIKPLSHAINTKLDDEVKTAPTKEAKKDAEVRRKKLLSKSIQFQGVQTQPLETLRGAAKNQAQVFSKNLSGHMIEGLSNFAQEFFKPILKNQGPTNAKEIKNALKTSENKLLSPDAEGIFFEKAIKLYLGGGKNPAAFMASLGADTRAPWDFEEGTGVSKEFREGFGFSARLIKADAKRTINKDTLQEVIPKTYAGVLEQGLGTFGDLPLVDYVRGGAGSIAGKSWAVKRGIKSPVTDTENKLKSLGFVPNFAGIKAAVDRENAAGISRRDIRVGMDKRLKSGVGVYNTSEGSLSDAIDMHLASGATKKSIQTMGAAKGYVPNFMVGLQRPTVGKSSPNAKFSTEPPKGGEGGKGEEMGFGFMIAMTTAGAQVETWSEKLRESENFLVRFGGSMGELIGSLALWGPTLGMITQSFGGLAAIGTKLQKSNFGSIMNTEFLQAGGRGKAGQRLASRSGFRKPVEFGGGWKGTAQRGVGKISGGIGKVAGTAGRALGAVGGVVGGGAMLGAGLVGGAAVLGAKMYKTWRNAAFDDASISINKNLDKNADHFKRLSESLSVTASATSKYTEAIRAGDQVKALAAKREMKASLVKGGVGKLLQSKPITAGGKTFKSTADVMAAFTSGNDDLIAELQQKIADATQKFGNMNTAAGDVSAVLQDFQSAQGWISDDLSGDQIRKASEGFAKALSDLTPDQASSFKSELLKMQGQMKDFGKHVSTGEIKQTAGKFANLIKGLDIEESVRNDLVKQFRAVATTTNLDEEALRKLFNALIDKAVPSLTRLGDSALTASEIIEIKVNPAFAQVTASLNDYARRMEGAALDLNLTVDVNKIIRDGAQNMIAEGNKFYLNNLKKSFGPMTNVFEQIRRGEAESRFKRETGLKGARAKTAQDLQKIISTELLRGKQSAGARNPAMFMGRSGSQAEKLMEMFEPLITIGATGVDVDKPVAQVEEALDEVTKNLGEFVQGPTTGPPNPDLALEALRSDLAFDPKLMEDIGGIFDKLGLSSSLLGDELTKVATQYRAEIALLKLRERLEKDKVMRQQRLDFADEAARSPQSFIKRFDQAQADVTIGRATGDVDLETKGLIDQAKMFQGVTLGGVNAAEPFETALADKFAKNMEMGLRGMGYDLGSGDMQAIRESAALKAETFIKPEKTQEQLIAVNEALKNEIVRDISQQEKLLVAQEKLTNAINEATSTLAQGFLSAGSVVREGGGSIGEKLKETWSRTKDAADKEKKQRMEAAKQLDLEARAGGNALTVKQQKMLDEGKDPRELLPLQQRIDELNTTIKRMKGYKDQPGKVGPIGSLYTPSQYKQILEDNLKELKRLKDLQKNPRSGPRGNRGFEGTSFSPNEEWKAWNAEMKKSGYNVAYLNSVLEDTSRHLAAGGAGAAWTPTTARGISHPMFVDGRWISQPASGSTHSGHPGVGPNQSPATSRFQDYIWQPPRPGEMLGVSLSTPADSHAETVAKQKKQAEQMTAGLARRRTGRGGAAGGTPGVTSAEDLAQETYLKAQTAQAMKLAGKLTSDEQAKREKGLGTQGKLLAGALLNKDLPMEHGALMMNEQLRKMGALSLMERTKGRTPISDAELFDINETLGKQGLGQLTREQAEKQRGITTPKQRDKILRGEIKDPTGRMISRDEQFNTQVKGVYDNFQKMQQEALTLGVPLNEMEKISLDLRKEGEKLTHDNIKTQEQLTKAQNKLALAMTKVTRATNAQKSQVTTDRTFDQFEANLIGTSELQQQTYQNLMDSINEDGIPSMEAWGDAIKSKFSYNTNQAMKDMVELSLNLSDQLKQGLKDAIYAGITGARNFREVMSEVFQSMQKELTKQAISSFVEAGVGGLKTGLTKILGGGKDTGKARGGLIKRYAGGGMVTGGSGNRDDVPAYLQAGEYVVRKSAVQKYGPELIERLNDRKVNRNSLKRRRFQGGGYANKGFAFSTDELMTNQYDFTGSASHPSGGSFNVDSRLSALAQTDSNNPMNQLKWDRESALQNYLKERQAYEEDKKRQMEAYKKRRMGVWKQLGIQIAMNVATAGLGKLLSGAGKAAADAKDDKSEIPKDWAETSQKNMDAIGAETKALNQQMQHMPYGYDSSFDYKPMNALGGRYGMIRKSSTPQMLDIPKFSRGGYISQHGLSSGWSSVLGGANMKYGFGKQTGKGFGGMWSNRMDLGSLLGLLGGMGGGMMGGMGGGMMGGMGGGGAGLLGGVKLRHGFGKQTGKGFGGEWSNSIGLGTLLGGLGGLGGMVGFANGGSAGRDNVPSLLMGGEYVVKKDAVDKYGVNFFDRLNGGRLKHFAEGGYVGEGAPNAGGEGVTGGPSSVSNNINISVTVEKNGNVTSTTGNEEDENKNTNENLSETERAQDFAKKIKGAVVNEIVYQQRPGGLLYDDKRN